MGLEKQGVSSFVMGKKQEDGGFSFAKTAPSTLEDTYYALKILETLSIPYANKKTSGYLAGLNFDALMIKHVFQLCDLLSTKSMKSIPARKIARNIRLAKMADLEELYYKLEIMRLLKIGINKKDISEELRLIKTDKRGCLQDACYKAAILKILDEPFDKKDCADKINGFQNADGGWGFVRGSTSFLENSHAAIKALAVTGGRPRDMRECKRFISGCQAKDGGFGRQIMAVPSLEATYQAIASLKIIEGMEKSRG